MQGLRGLSATFIFVDEFTLLGESMFVEIIAPLLAVAGTSVIGVSTPRAMDSYFMRMMYGNKHIDFNIMDLGLVCEHHAASKEPWRCRCNLNRLPWWKPLRRHLEVERMLHDNPVMFAQEQLGYVDINSDSIFDSEAVADLYTRERVDCERDAPAGNRVYVAIDPTGGSASHFAIVSFYLKETGGGVVVVGLESQQIVEGNHEHQDRLVDAHLLALRTRNPVAAGRSVVLTSILEANSGWVISSRLSAQVDQYPPTFHISEPGRTGVGIWTTNEMKRDMAAYVGRMLKNRHIYFARDEHFVCCGSAAFHDVPEPRGDPRAIQRLLRDQLAVYRVVIKKPTDVHKQARFVYTGKAGDQQDDLCVAFQFGIQRASVW